MPCEFVSVLVFSNGRSLVALIDRRACICGNKCTFHGGYAEKCRALMTDATQAGMPDETAHQCGSRSRAQKRLEPAIAGSNVRERSASGCRVRDESQPTVACKRQCMRARRPE